MGNSICKQNQKSMFQTSLKTIGVTPCAYLFYRNWICWAQFLGINKFEHANSTKADDDVFIHKMYTNHIGMFCQEIHWKLVINKVKTNSQTSYHNILYPRRHLFLFTVFAMQICWDFLILDKRKVRWKCIWYSHATTNFNPFGNKN